MGAFAPPAAWNKPKAKPPAVDPAVREAPLKALLALGLEKLATAGCDDRCYAATTPGRPLCVLVPGGGSGPTDAGLWSTLDFAIADPEAGAVCHYAARVLARGWSVCVAPPASGSAEDADTIDAAVKAARRAGDAPVVAVVAHSLGGAAAAAWLRRRDRSKPPYDPCAVALLDGTHRGRDPAGPCVNWCTSRKPLDDPNPRPWSRGAAPAWNCYAVRSAGTSDHKRVPFAAAGAVFAYLLLGETLSPSATAGAVLILASTVVGSLGVDDEDSILDADVPTEAQGPDAGGVPRRVRRRCQVRRLHVHHVAGLQPVSYTHLTLPTKA